MPVHTTARAVRDAVGQIAIGHESTFENLSIVALLGHTERDPEYVTLDAALASGAAQITEVSNTGQVSSLTVVVTGPMPVLLLDGEELIGAKQNRVVNLSILAPPQRTTVIPVSCVESGRWHHVSRGFASAPRAQFAEGRAAKMRQVTVSLRNSGSRASDQGAVWNQISEKAARLNAISDTSAMSAVFEKLHIPLDQFVAAFPPVDRQIGGVVFINGREAGLELFDAASTWRTLAPKLVRSYAMDAVDRRDVRMRRRRPHAVETFMTAVAVAPASVFPAIGQGVDVRITGTGVAGAALVAGDRVIHLSAFPAADRTQ
jgi:ARG/rhodanese/phosphatase superfamily protein